MPRPLILTRVYDGLKPYSTETHMFVTVMNKLQRLFMLKTCVRKRHNNFVSFFVLTQNTLRHVGAGAAPAEADCYFFNFAH